MASMIQTANLSLGHDGILRCSGAWRMPAVPFLQRQLAQVRWTPRRQIWEMSGITSMDTTGVWFVRLSMPRLQRSGREVELRGLRPEFDHLVRWVSEDNTDGILAARPQPRRFIDRLGRAAWSAWLNALSFLSFVGESTWVLVRLAANPRRIRWQAFFYNLKAGGLEAIPIVGLLSFLMGVVIAYQAAVQLRPYGAAVFIVEFVGISMLREIAPVITAIIVAGRSGSAYTAQIGTMKVTEEVDALRTMGIGPLELLVAPKVLALMLALPLLTAFADVTGVFG